MVQETQSMNISKKMSPAWDSEKLSGNCTCDHRHDGGNSYDHLRDDGVSNHVQSDRDVYILHLDHRQEFH